MKKDLSIIMLNYNGTNDTIACIESLDKLVTKYSYRIVILDNGSRSEKYQELELYCKDRNDFTLCLLENFNAYLNKGEAEKFYLVKSDDNLGFAKGNNEIIRRVLSYSKYVLLLNNDTEVTEDFVEKMLDFLSLNADVKYASCRINNYYDQNLLWSCGGKYRAWGNRHGYTERELGKKGNVIKTPYITGCALFLETDMLKQQGLLTEDFFYGEEDFNFGWRMKTAKIKGACLKEVLVYHKVSQTSNRSGNLIGKLAGYYSSRIIDMHKFYSPVIWQIWKECVILFVVFSGVVRQRMSINEVKQLVKTIRLLSYNTKMTKEDCFNIHMI